MKAFGDDQHKNRSMLQGRKNLFKGVDPLFPGSLAIRMHTPGLKNIKAVLSTPRSERSPFVTKIDKSPLNDSAVPKSAAVEAKRATLGAYFLPENRQFYKRGIPNVIKIVTRPSSPRPSSSRPSTSRPATVPNKDTTSPSPSSRPYTAPGKCIARFDADNLDTPETLEEKKRSASPSREVKLLHSRKPKPMHVIEYDWLYPERYKGDEQEDPSRTNDENGRARSRERSRNGSPFRPSSTESKTKSAIGSYRYFDPHFGGIRPPVSRESDHTKSEPRSPQAANDDFFEAKLEDFWDVQFSKPESSWGNNEMQGGLGNLQTPEAFQSTGLGHMTIQVQPDEEDYQKAYFDDLRHTLLLTLLQENPGLHRSPPTLQTNLEASTDSWIAGHTIVNDPEDVAVAIEHSETVARELDTFDGDAAPLDLLTFQGSSTRSAKYGGKFHQATSRAAALVDRSEISDLHLMSGMYSQETATEPHLYPPSDPTQAPITQAKRKKKKRKKMKAPREASNDRGAVGSGRQRSGSSSSNRRKLMSVLRQQQGGWGGWGGFGGNSSKGSKASKGSNSSKSNSSSSKILFQTSRRAANGSGLGSEIGLGVDDFARERGREELAEFADIWMGQTAVDGNSGSGVGAAFAVDGVAHKHGTQNVGEVSASASSSKMISHSNSSSGGVISVSVSLLPHTKKVETEKAESLSITDLRRFDGSQSPMRNSRAHGRLSSPGLAGGVTGSEAGVGGGTRAGEAAAGGGSPGASSRIGVEVGDTARQVVAAILGASTATDAPVDAPVDAPLAASVASRRVLEENDSATKATWPDDASSRGATADGGEAAQVSLGQYADDGGGGDLGQHSIVQERTRFLFESSRYESLGDYGDGGDNDDCVELRPPPAVALSIQINRDDHDGDQLDSGGGSYFMQDSSPLTEPDIGPPDEAGGITKTNTFTDSEVKGAESPPTGSQGRGRRQRGRFPGSPQPTRPGQRPVGSRAGAIEGSDSRFARSPPMTPSRSPSPSDRIYSGNVTPDKSFHPSHYISSGGSSGPPQNTSSGRSSAPAAELDRSPPSPAARSYIPSIPSSVVSHGGKLSPSPTQPRQPIASARSPLIAARLAKLHIDHIGHIGDNSTTTSSNRPTKSPSSPLHSPLTLLPSSPVKPFTPDAALVPKSYFILIDDEPETRTATSASASAARKSPLQQGDTENITDGRSSNYCAAAVPTGRVEGATAEEILLGESASIRNLAEMVATSPQMTSEGTLMRGPAIRSGRRLTITSHSLSHWCSAEERFAMEQHKSMQALRSSHRAQMQRQQEQDERDLLHRVGVNFGITGRGSGGGGGGGGGDGEDVGEKDDIEAGPISTEVGRRRIALLRRQRGILRSVLTDARKWLEQHKQRFRNAVKSRQAQQEQGKKTKIVKPSWFSGEGSFFLSGQHILVDDDDDDDDDDRRDDVIGGGGNTEARDGVEVARAEGPSVNAARSGAARDGTNVVDPLDSIVADPLDHPAAGPLDSPAHPLESSIDLGDIVGIQTTDKVEAANPILSDGPNITTTLSPLMTITASASAPAEEATELNAASPDSVSTALPAGVPAVVTAVVPAVVAVEGSAVATAEKLDDENCTEVTITRMQSHSARDDAIANVDS